MNTISFTFTANPSISLYAFNHRKTNPRIEHFNRTHLRTNLHSGVRYIGLSRYLRVIEIKVIEFLI